MLKIVCSFFYKDEKTEEFNFKNEKFNILMLSSFIILLRF